MDPQLEKAFQDNLPPSWKNKLSQEFDQDYFKKLTQFLTDEYQSKKKIYPRREWILRALKMVDYDDIKVVILGQDPYHGEGQAIGLCFGVPNELLTKPPSLKNIFKEMESDLGIQVSKNLSDLTGWAEQGVLLLNTILTVRHQQAFSHRDTGWEYFTDCVIAKLNEREKPVIFILWGTAAQKKKALIINSWHFILESAHPSPLSAFRGFYGSRPFSKVNEILVKKLNQRPIDWARVCDSR